MRRCFYIIIQIIGTVLFVWAKNNMFFMVKWCIIVLIANDGTAYEGIIYEKSRKEF